jgi:hypothetical protein
MFPLAPAISKGEICVQFAMAYKMADVVVGFLSCKQQFSIALQKWPEVVPFS